MKFKSCQIRDSQWVDYLEHNLDPRTVAELDAHLLSCEQCRSNLEIQQKWLQLQTRYLAPDKEAHILNEVELADLNKRIMQAVRLESAQTAATGTARLPFWRQRSFWYQSAGAAAMIVLLLISVQLILKIPALAGRTMKTTAMIDFIAGEQQDAETQDVPGQGATEAAAPTTTLAAMGNDLGSGWRIYSGSFADLPAASIFFDNPEVKSGETTACATREILTDSSQETAVVTTDGGAIPEATTADESTSYQGTDTEMTTVDRMELLVNSFNTRGKSMYGVLSNAESVRVLTDQGGSEQILILAAYPTDRISETQSAIAEILEGCQTIIKIKIIKTEQLTDFLDGFEAGLFDKTFETSGSSGQSWISILIGA